MKDVDKVAELLEKEHELKRRLEDEFNKKLEAMRRKYEKELEEREELFKAKLELEARKREDVMRDMYKVELERKEKDLRQKLEEEFRRDLEAKLREKEIQMGKKCELKTAYYLAYPYPFTAIVGQEIVKKALILNAINPAIGGVLLWGKRGVGKRVALKGIGELFPEREELSCLKDTEYQCFDCAYRYEEETISVEGSSVHYLLDRVLNSAAVSIESKLSESALLTPRSSRTAEEFISAELASKVVVFDKIPLHIEVRAINDMEQRLEIIRRQREFKINPENFRKKFRSSQTALIERIKRARRILPVVTVSEELLRTVVKVCREQGVESHSTEALIELLARTQCAYEGRHRVTVDDLVEAVNLVLLYGGKVKALKEGRELTGEQLEALVKMYAKK